ncbi:hypothetical protein GA0111570_104122 [Raineyella antarctica]|uniref:Tat (Twin-arginine translocation) pathway signal sequence n=1 Tax=Raineyella antarctica TaxID=1577474 RepID=A0A1G6GMW9_9ACTN|nr:alkaline phosphatase PhoX [Raineyella antarctica]SDB83321.1 hypothetical protein GA0111570_104122 [Raineyella antarctica]
MTSNVSRRGFLGGSAVSLGFALAGAGSLAPFVRTAAADTRPSLGYGKLVHKPGAVLALPEGFDYKVIAKAGETAGGLVHPSDPDAMGVFPGSNGGSVLVTNHENSGSEKFPVPHVDERLVYDAMSIGGTTTIVVDAANNNTQQYVSVAGTHNNCAGGVSPWGTWLTCEETEAKAKAGGLQKDHGYVFEVDPTSQAANYGKSNVPLKFLGRYAHEAVAIDPSDWTVYGTEDAGNPNGLFFRWTAPKGFKGGKEALVNLAKSEGGDTAGVLEAMKCFAGSTFVGDLSEATQPGTRYKVQWIDVPDRDAKVTSIRKQFADGEITRSRKLEGMWWADGGTYFVASFARTSDGSAKEHDGQVWFYDPKSQTVTLKTIFAVNTDPDAEGNNFDGPDNITVSPDGGLILAEDGDGKSHLVGVTKEGKAYPLALNTSGDSEFCGPAFNQAGSTLFVNIQGPGYTLAITGPFGDPSNANVENAKR